MNSNSEESPLPSLAYKSSDSQLFLGEIMSNAKLVRCRKCRKPLGYVTVLGKALLLRQPLQNVRIIGICIECFQKEN